MKRTACLTGYAMLIYLGATFTVQVILSIGAAIVGMLTASGSPVDALNSSMSYMTNGTFLMISSIISSYIAAPLSAWLFLRKLPEETPVRGKLNLKNAALSVCVCVGMLYIFGYVSEGILWAVSKIFNTTADKLNAVNVMSDQFSTLQYVILICICAPVVEELFFRKFLIKKMLPYGRVPAVVLSAAVFGLVHCTLSQIPYALALGLVLGYIYLKFGNIYLNIALHAVMNFMGGVFYILIDKVPHSDVIGMILEIVFMLGAVIIVVLSIKDIKQFVSSDAGEVRTSVQIKEVLCNTGFIIFAVVCFVVMIFSIIGTIIS